MDVLSADISSANEKTVFGDFLSSNKKLPAGRRTAEAFVIDEQKLDSSFRWNDEPRQRS
jgi:hypothetical protein